MDGQSEVNTMYLQFYIADEQEASYVEEYEELTLESSGEWHDRWTPTLNDEEIEKIAWSLSDMVDGCDRQQNVQMILSVLRPNVKGFKAYLEHDWGDNLGYDTAESIGLEQSQF